MSLTSKSIVASFAVFENNISCPVRHGGFRVVTGAMFLTEGERTLKRALGIFASLALVAAAAACGGDDDATDDTPGTPAPADQNGAAPAVAGGEIVIGSVFSQTGPWAATGLDGFRTIDMAIADINDAGGFEVDGQTYTLVHETRDLQSDANLGASHTQDLIQGAGARFIFGTETSAGTAPVTNTVLRDGNTLMISVATNFDEVVGQAEPMFRTVPPDFLMVNRGFIPRTAEMLADDVQRIAIMHQNDPVGTSLADSYAETWEEYGVEVAQIELFAAGETSFVPILQRLPSDIDALWIGWYDDSTMAAIMDAAEEIGIRPYFISRGVSAIPGLERQDEIEAYFFTILGEDPNAPSTDAAQELLDRYTERYGVDASQVTWFLYTYYDYVAILVEAMKEAGTVDDVEAIAQAIRGMEYDGVVAISYDDEGINTSPAKVGLITPDGVEVVEAPLLVD